jgi:hypothetical protein
MLLGPASRTSARQQQWILTSESAVVLQNGDRLRKAHAVRAWFAARRILLNRNAYV